MIGNERFSVAFLGVWKKGIFASKRATGDVLRKKMKNL
jgi:hypothetical protein